MLNNSRDEEIKERLLPFKENFERLKVQQTQPNTTIQQSDDEEQDFQSNDRSKAVDNKQVNSETNDLFKAIDNLQFTNKQALPFQPLILE